jgi:hypothetical protein
VGARRFAKMCRDHCWDHPFSDWRCSYGTKVRGQFAVVFRSVSVAADASSSQKLLNKLGSLLGVH